MSWPFQEHINFFSSLDDESKNREMDMRLYRGVGNTEDTPPRAPRTEGKYMVAEWQLHSRMGFQEWVSEGHKRGTSGTLHFCLRQLLLLQNRMYKFTQYPSIGTCNIYANLAIVY